MSGATQARRIDTLEQQVGAFESRFDSLDRQISDFRLDVAAEFVAMRQEVGVQISQLRDEMHVADSAIRDELRKEIRDGDEETRRYMRVLHEKVIERIARLGEPSS